MKKILLQPWTCLVLAFGCAACSVIDGFFAEPPSPSKHVVKTATSTCTYLDRDNLYHRLYACETAASYEVWVLEVSHHYDKGRLKASLRSELQHYAKSQPKLAAALPAAVIDVWLAAPAFRPDQAYLVAWIKAPGASQALRLPFQMDGLSWSARSRMYLPSEGDGYKSSVFSFAYLEP